MFWFVKHDDMLQKGLCNKTTVFSRKQLMTYFLVRLMTCRATSISDNAAVDGAGLAVLDDSSLTVTDCLLQHNTAVHNGAAVTVAARAHVSRVPERLL
jgi:hypothetical protein